MLPSFANQTIAIKRAPLVDSRGTKIRDWTHASTHEVMGCSFQPVSSDMDFDARENVVIDAVVYAPSDADILAADRVEYMGRTYTVVGAPLQWVSPTGAVSHIQVELEAWRG